MGRGPAMIMTEVDRVGGLAAIASEAARSLCRVRMRNGGAYVSTPMTYPSGASVCVRIDDCGNGYSVSDAGLGCHEAVMGGAERSFLRHAKKAAAEEGMQFADSAFFLQHIPVNGLPGAIAAVAALSVKSAAAAIQHTEEVEEPDYADVIYDRLIRVFPSTSVERDVDVVGGSNTRWKVSSMVKIGGRTAVFEPVRRQHNSIATVVTKFQDLGTSASPPTRVAVVRTKADFGTWLNLLSQVGSVVDETVPDASLRQVINTF